MIEALLIFMFIYLVMWAVTIVLLVWDALDYEVKYQDYLVIIMFSFFWWILLIVYISDWNKLRKL